MSKTGSLPATTMDTTRLEALCDGVVAIAMTLLVFDLKIPDLLNAPDLGSMLVKLWPNFLGYAISFMLLGIYWLGHRAQYHYIQKADHTLHWLNILFLALVSLVPFSTKILSRFYNQRLALIIYGINQILIGLTLFRMWRYATHEKRIVSHELSDLMITLGNYRCLLAPICYLIAIGISFLNVNYCLILFALTPLIYLVPPTHHLWIKVSQKHHPN